MSDARAIVIGCMLNGGLEVARKITVQLEREDFGTDFYGERFAKCFDVLCGFVKENKEFDIVMVADELKKRGIERPLKFLDACQEMAYNPLMYPYYVRKVRERRLKLDAQDILKRMEVMELEDVLDEVEKLAHGFIPEKQTRKIDESLDVVLQRLERHSGPDFNFSLSKLNEQTGGLLRGELMVIGGWTSQGKSSLCINLALDVAMRHRVLFCSSEMTEQEIARRIYARICEIPVNRIRKGALSDEEIQKMKDVREIVRSCEFYIALVHSTKQVAQAVVEVKPDIVFVDHLHHLEGYGRSEYEIVSENIKNIQKIAVRENIGMIVAAQLHRKEGREIRPPQINDLRASGQIEENAQILLLLYWKWHFDNESGDKNVMECFLAKNRDGKIGSFELYWDPEICKFSDLEREQIWAK
ncbi:MAG: AAA family ATPase [Candidatus Aenigmarchaeota archaeon]|nr:AAA family ATPase [Candidatus Aenigmarchaeota archaeon]